MKNDDRVREIADLEYRLNAQVKDCQSAIQEAERLQGYLKDAVSALESMPGTAEEWHKYTRWAEGLRKQTVERIKRELNIP